MRVLLIHPFITLSNISILQSEPLGLACIAAFIRQEHEVKILDLFALGIHQRIKIEDKYRIGISDESEIVKRVTDFNPDVVGITSNFTSYAEDSFAVARIIKANFPNVPIILGGAHASMDAENILKSNTSIDLIVRGEGEETFKLYLDCMQKNKDYTWIDGIVYRQGNTIVMNPKRKMLKDINELPFPARDLLEIDTYKEINRLNMPDVKNTPVLTLLTSRGCPFDCVFCSTKVVWERRWRSRSPENVVDEMESMIKNYGVKEIAIYDDQFIANKKRVGEICDLIIARNLNISISIPSGVSGWLLDEDLLKKMKSAGFYRLSLSIETGNEQTLKFIKKPVNLQKMKSIIEMCHRLGFWVQSNFIIGFPYETLEEIQETIAYANNSGLDYVLFLIAQPYAGAELYDIYVRDGMLVKTSSQIATNSIVSANYDTKYFTAHELQVIREKATVDFLVKRFISYLNPLYFWKTLFPKIFLVKGGVRYAFKVFFVILNEKILHRSRIEEFYKKHRKLNRTV